MTFFNPYNYWTVQTFLLMADSAYERAKKANYSGWTTDLPKKLPAVLQNGTYFLGPHDAEAKVFYRDGEITIAFCGTNSTTDQIYVDRHIMNGSYPKTYTDLFKPLVSAILKAYGKDTVINLTGHSLGGAVVNDMASRPGQFGIKNLGDAIAYSSPYVVKDPAVRNFGNDNDQIFKYLQPKSQYYNTSDNLHWIGDSPNAASGATPHTSTEDYSAHILKSLKSTFARMGHSFFKQDLIRDSEVYAMGFNRVYKKTGFDVFDAGSYNALYNTFNFTGKGYKKAFLLGVDETTKSHQIKSDYLEGSVGADRIEGFRGNDVLVGRQGKDVMVGGLGNDYFVATAGDQVYAGIGHDVVELRGTDVKVRPETSNGANDPRALNAVDFVFNKDGGDFNWATYVKNMNDTVSRAAIGKSVSAISFEYDAKNAPTAKLVLNFNKLSDQKRVVSFDVAGGDQGTVGFAGGGDADHNNTLVFKNFGKSDNRFAFYENKYNAVYQDIDKIVMKQIDVVLTQNINDFSNAKLKSYTSNHIGDWILAKTSAEIYTAFHVTAVADDVSDLVKSASFVNLHLSELEI